MSNNEQPLDLTEPLLVATGATATSDPLDEPYGKTGYEASSSTPIIDRITDVSQTPYYVNKSDAKTTPNLSHSDELTIGFLLDCAERGETRGKQSQPYICKVSRIHRDLSESSFTPQLVSIGPIHREDPKLIEFECQKERYLDDLLKRCHDSTPKKALLEACLLRVNTLIPKIRESYAGVKKNYSDVDLARMMVMDGFFILEFCFKHKNKDKDLPNKMQNLRIAMDLILLENQVPFFVLKALFDCLPDILMKNGPVTDLSQVLDNYLAPYIILFHSLTSEKTSTTHVTSDSTQDHVLGYMHKRCQLQHVAAKSPNPLENTVFHSIEELDRSGVNFKPHQEGNWSLTIKFQSSHFACLPWIWKPTLLMPTLVVDETTELILRNFIAYEQSFPQGRNYFTSYVHAMDMLIDTQEDVAILAESKVLFNNLCSNREAADMINKIGENMFVTDFYYTEEFKQMDKYYNGFWPKIKRTYFSNPWNVINLLAGIIVFIATVVGVIFAVLEYFR